MSKGIGASYLSDNIRAWHLADLENRMYCPIEDGKKIAMPRYYKNKIYTEQQREIAGQATLDRIRQKQETSESITPHEHEQARRAAYKRMYKNSVNLRDKI